MRITAPGALLLALTVVTALAQTPEEAGMEQYRSGKLADAERTLRDASEKDAKAGRARLYLILTYAEQNKSREAADAAVALEEALPDSDWARLGRARVLIQQKEFDRASELLEKAKAANPDSAEVLFLTGLLEAARKNYSDAVKHFEAAIEKDFQNAYAHYYAALSYQGLKRPDKMVEHFRHFLKLAPGAPEAAKVQSFMRAVR
jgi:tetratricopeptide (TPR) repeat protein